MIKCILKRLLKEHREECYRCLSIGKIKLKMYSSKYAFRQLQEDISRLDQRYDDLNSQHRQLVSQYVHLQDCYENLSQNIPELINRSHKRQTDRLSKFQKEQDRQAVRRGAMSDQSTAAQCIHTSVCFFEDRERGR